MARRQIDQPCYLFLLDHLVNLIAMLYQVVLMSYDWIWLGPRLVIPLASWFCRCSY